ncbi:2,5-diketo-D-gluconic acid reductase [Xylocopilactobacillus apicola]|uniref:2,5-diketo-D-gluconic acid reductase n=2 Tax=Xylocopilactobacillus apicola TaxID=2932184 RepID=A0AAU9DY34_9LACO|nr:2,5-diketo-D-gluconic acid reductase [Xylocopilactobacillus apicola]
METDYYQLANGVKIPVVGFGTWQSANGKEAYNAVKWALESGYRHLDTAAVYGNEESVGKAIKDSGIKREDIFLTTKLWNSQRGSYDNVLRAFEDSLTRLDQDYVDLYLIHWPVPTEFEDRWEQVNAETWRAMEEIYQSGRAKAIGVSNFRAKHLSELQKTWQIAPMVNQIFLNPGDPETELVKLNQKLGILTEAYSPLGTGNLLNNPVVQEVAQAHHKSGAQVLIRWCLENNYLPLPKSIHEEYIQDNAKVFDFSLTESDHQKLASLAGTTPQHHDPDHLDLLKEIHFL